MRARHLLALLCFLFLYTGLSAQNLWSDVQPDNARSYTRSRESHLPTQYRLVKLNRSLASQKQLQAPIEDLSNRNKTAVPVSFDIPLPGGELLKGRFVESPILSVRTQALINNVKTYRLTDAKGNSTTGRLTFTSAGITGIIFTDQGTVYISPLGTDNPDVHMVYYVKDSKHAEQVVCGIQQEASQLRENGTTAGDAQLRTYDLAVVASGGYTWWAGSQANALTYITITVNSLNAIYERDAGIHFNLVTNNSIIFPDSTTDPYPTVGFPTGTAGGTLDINVTTINGALGAGNYDVGIVFNYAWNGGLAQLSSACGASKARAAAGLNFGVGANPLAGPQGPVFEGTVAHEIAHQFSATHTHGATNGQCGGGNSSPGTAWEPGGGSTIMAYAGTCTGNAYQGNSDLYFHTGSIAQIQTFNLAAGCPVITSTGNTAPGISVAASAYTIPASTPFTLTATGTDANNNTLTYTWEQLNAGTSGAPPSAASTSGPNFRPFPPSTTAASRTFPNMAAVLAGTTPTYEVLPSVGRTMNFRATVRDNAVGNGSTAEASVAVTTDGSSGPFTVTSQNTATPWTANGSNTATITWNVANTNNAPVSCSNVNILFSIDGGVTFPYTLLANTANDGTENIVIPNLPTSAGRLMVQSAGNVFFNVNAATITITSSCAAEAATVTPSTTVTASAGSSTLDLTLSPLYGTAVTLNGQLAVSDPASFLAVNNGAPGACLSAGGNEFRYDTYQFVVNVGGTYTFTRTPSNTNSIFNLYNGSFNPGSPCTNLINSNGTFVSPSVNIANSFSATLTPGFTYTMAIGTFSANNPALPYNYNIAVSAPAGGGLFSSTPNPGAGFNYTYVIVNNATGNIVAIDAGANLSNAGTFPSGDFTVYGLSYANSIAPATLNAFIGGSFSALQNAALYSPGTVCSNLSKNSVPVSITATLPVQFLPLKASKAGNTALLQWGTSNEQHSSHFEVLRSADGNNFSQVIGTVQAQGNSNTTTNYSFTDQTPGAGINYYRIRQFDTDGRSSLSNIASVNMSQAPITIRVYPSPARSSVTLDYATDKRETIRVQVTDSKGATVLTAQLNAQPGTNTKAFNISGLAKGIYAVQITGSSGSTLSRFVKE